MAPDWEPTDGLKIETGWTVFADEAFFDAIEVWYEIGEAAVTCRSCDRASDLTSWRWAGEYFAFGYLGFEFWNWPEFAPGFVDELAHVLGGHRVIRVWGKV